MYSFWKQYNFSIMGFVAWAAILGLSCDTLRTQRISRKLSVARAEEECLAPMEFFPISPMAYGLEATVMRHDDCMGIPNLLMVLWAGEQDELNTSIAKILALMYFKSMEVTSHKFLKVASAEDRPAHIMFYEIHPPSVPDETAASKTSPPQ